MFSFFKKKPKPEDLAAPQAAATPIAEATAPVNPSTAEPLAPAAPAVIAAPAPAVTPVEPEAPRKQSWTERLKAGLSKTRDKLGKSLAGLFGGGKIDEDLYEELETVLLTADMGVPATMHLLKDVRERVTLRGLKDASELKQALKDSLSELIAPLQIPLDTQGHQPCVIMLAGVNGAGKTTSIGKLAHLYAAQGKRVLLVDRQAPGHGASWGNAGHLATEQVFPIADLSILKRLPAMLMDPMGPLRLDWKYLPRALPWFARLLLNLRLLLSLMLNRLRLRLNLWLRA